MQVYYDNLLKEMYNASDKAHAMFESESQIKIFFFHFESNIGEFMFRFVNSVLM